MANGSRGNTSLCSQDPSGRASTNSATSQENLFTLPPTRHRSADHCSRTNIFRLPAFRPSNRYSRTLYRVANSISIVLVVPIYTVFEPTNQYPKRRSNKCLQARRHYTLRRTVPLGPKGLTTQLLKSMQELSRAVFEKS